MLKFKKSSYAMVLVVSLSTILVGCADLSARPDVYQRSQLQKAQVTNFATIVSLKPILIEQDEGSSNSIMSIAGTALGAIAGAQLGGGTGRIAGAIGGGLAGGYATNAVMGKIQMQKGIEFTVKLDNGQMLTFGQAGDINKYYTGQRVKLVTSNDGTTKIDSQ